MNKTLLILFIVLLLITLVGCTSSSIPAEGNYYSIKANCAFSSGSLENREQRLYMYEFIELEKDNKKSKTERMIVDNKIHMVDGELIPMKAFFVDKEYRMIGLRSKLTPGSKTNERLGHYTTFECVQLVENPEEKYKID